MLQKFCYLMNWGHVGGGEGLVNLSDTISVTISVGKLSRKARLQVLETWPAARSSRLDLKIYLCLCSNAFCRREDWATGAYTWASGMQDGSFSEFCFLLNSVRGPLSEGSSRRRKEKEQRNQAILSPLCVLFTRKLLGLLALMLCSLWFSSSGLVSI